jgi:hypothetical protein
MKALSESKEQILSIKLYFVASEEPGIPLHPHLLSTYYALIMSGYGESNLVFSMVTQPLEHIYSLSTQKALMQ